MSYTQEAVIWRNKKKLIESKRKYQAALALLALFGVSATFRVIGPGGGGAMFNPVISPGDPNTALVSCDMTGTYITHDGGRSWRMFNLGSPARFIKFDSADSNTIYIGNAALWRSRDSGEHWAMVYPPAPAVKAVEMNSDHAEQTIVAEPDPLGEIAAFAADGKTLWAVAGKRPALFVSRDAGLTWSREASLPERPLQLWVKGETVYAASAHHVTAVSGTVVKDSGAPAEFIDVSAAPPVFYGVTADAAYVSKDTGAHWTKMVPPGAAGDLQTIATSAEHPEIAYVSYTPGVAVTHDYGGHWTAAGTVHDAWITPALGADWGGVALAIGIDPHNPNLAYATDLGRTLKTTDGGANWTAVYSRGTEQAGYTSTGLDVTTSYGYHFDPFDHARQFITYTDIGLFRSENGGATWRSSTQGVPREWRNTTYWVAFDPAVRGRMWSVNSDTHDLPRPKMWRHRSVLAYKGGVCRSDDGGRTWKQSNSGMDETAATHILLDPSSPEHARTLYVAAFGRGVYKSTDDGRTWTLKNNGITQKEPFAWRLVRSAGGDLYLIVARRSENASIGGEGDGALYRSSDGGEHWTPVRLPEGVNGPNGLAIDPQNARRMFLAAWARPVGVHGQGGGIYETEDGGQSWRCVLDRDQHIYDVTIDTNDPKLIYAAGFESSAWRSTDAGASWKRIPGFDFKWAHRVILDARSMYVTTFGGSVWRAEK